MPRPRPAWAGNWKIPTWVNLPGLRVRVKVVPPDEAEVLGGTDGLWLYDYEKGSAVVMIDGTHSVPVQRYILCHELQHVLVDYLDVMLEKFPGQIHTKSYEEETTQLPDIPLHTPTPVPPEIVLKTPQPA